MGDRGATAVGMRRGRTGRLFATAALSALTAVCAGSGTAWAQTPLAGGPGTEPPPPLRTPSPPSPPAVSPPAAPVVATPPAEPAEPTPPLMRGEHAARTKNGCWVVFSRPEDAGPAWSAEAETRKIGEMVWKGECRSGLAHGWGGLYREVEAEQYRDVKVDYGFGRSFDRHWFPSFPSGSFKLAYGAFGRGVEIPVVDGDVYQPVWASPAEQLSGKRAAEFRGRDGWAVRTEKAPCATDPAAFPDCQAAGGYDVHGVTVYPSDKIPGGARFNEPGSGVVTTWCPNPKASAGCEGVWLQKAEPILAGIRAYIQVIDQRNAARMVELAALNAEWERDFGKPRSPPPPPPASPPPAAPVVQTSTQPAEPGAPPAPAPAVAPAGGDAGGVRLETMNAGELFAHADAERAAGRRDGARAALRQLLSRYPEHPLAVIAAQQLTQLN